MEIAFDPVKNRRNIVERGLGFSRAAEMDFETTIFFIDERKDYGEIRHIVVGYLDSRLHILCYVECDTGIRVISFRKANMREAHRYDKPLTINR
ncbi:MAG: BrnT family toxin [Candidimonas sp.]|nr:MAG: BrnT family toxin [Candidimonas sp.]